MTLDEAIKHCEEVATEKCDACGEEHRQLAGWLKELKRDRNILERLFFCPLDGMKCNHDCKACVARNKDEKQ